MLCLLGGVAPRAGAHASSALLREKSSTIATPSEFFLRAPLLDGILGVIKRHPFISQNALCSLKMIACDIMVQTQIEGEFDLHQAHFNLTPGKGCRPARTSRIQPPNTGSELQIIILSILLSTYVLDLYLLLTTRSHRPNLGQPGQEADSCVCIIWGVIPRRDSVFYIHKSVSSALRCEGE